MLAQKFPDTLVSLEGYTRFAGVVRAALWERTDLMRLLQTYGTTPAPPGSAWDGKTPCLPGFERFCARAMGQHGA